MLGPCGLFLRERCRGRPLARQRHLHYRDSFRVDRPSNILPFDFRGLRLPLLAVLEKRSVRDDDAREGISHSVPLPRKETLLKGHFVCAPIGRRSGPVGAHPGRGHCANAGGLSAVLPALTIHDRSMRRGLFDTDRAVPPGRAVDRAMSRRRQRFRIRRLLPVACGPDCRCWRAPGAHRATVRAARRDQTLQCAVCTGTGRVGFRS
jgi:hypothetical protein